MANPNTPWSWLGLLKWSLSYTDGTVPSSESPSRMSDEDKAFLEKVMKDGIIDEGERMKTILKDLTGYLDRIKSDAEGGATIAGVELTQQEFKSDRPELDEDGATELLVELRDIVEQIDFARTFSAMGGLSFLLGCASERDAVPRSVRSGCLGVLATLCQNNVPVQDAMLAQGALDLLTDLFFKECQSPTYGGDADDSDGMLRGRVVQAMSCCVRGHALAEEKFCARSEARRVIEFGLGLYEGVEVLPKPSSSLKKRCLFFLRAIVTSDTADADRIGLYVPCIEHVASSFLDPTLEPDAEIREMSLGILDMLMKQGRNIGFILAKKGELVGLGVCRVKALRELDGDDREFARVELELWESLIVELARADMPTVGPKPEEDTSTKDPEQREESHCKSEACLLLK